LSVSRGSVLEILPQLQGGAGECKKVKKPGLKQPEINKISFKGFKEGP
jgi:hypothetical protein